MRSAILSAMGLLQLLASGVMAADRREDLSKIERKILKEPMYVADQRLYCLAVFGPTMQTRVWIVLDKSDVSHTDYDVAYVDRNANGDLTDEGERLTSAGSKVAESRFRIPEFKDPATGQTHTELSISTGVRGDTTQMIRLNWNGKLAFGGGYPQDPEHEKYLQFGRSIREAPIVWLNGDGPFTFQRWYLEKLRIGGDTDVKLFVGLPGEGQSSFCAFQVHALPPGEGVEGILHYETTAGEKRSVAFALLDKC